MTLKATILGCGTSGGVPRIGNEWGACDPATPKNRRRRCALLVEREGEKGATRVLVATPPDLREQLNDADVGLLDGLIHAIGKAGDPTPNPASPSPAAPEPR